MGLSFEETFAFAFQTHTKLFLLGAFIFFSLYIWLTAIFGSSVLGGSLVLFLSLTLGSISFVKIQYRSEPLYPNELTMVKDLPIIIEMVNFREIIVFVLGFISILLLIFFIYKKFSLKRESVISKPIHYSWRFISFVLSSLFILYVGQFNNPGNLVKDYYTNFTQWITYDQNKNYSNNGFTAGFLFNLGSIYMEKPPEYSKDTIDNLYEKYSKLADSINSERDSASLKDTNIIYIMNESFSDPQRINGFTTDKDPIPYTRDLMDKTLSGNSLAINIGGGTANSEFEALTGLSLEPFAPQVYAPYVEAADIMTHVPSIVNQANKDELTTTALHPHSPNLYKRLSVYDNLGFDTFIYNETMSFKDRLGKSSYISDMAAYKETMKIVDESKTKDFVHLVTMQNHISYRGIHENLTFNTTGTSNKEDGDGYMESLHYSDLALEELIDYVDNHDEEFLLVFWGDHLPGIYPEEVTSQNSALNLRQTPLFFYSNKRDLSGDVGTISPIYFLNNVLDILEVKVTPHQALLYDLEKDLPGIYGGIYLEGSNESPVSLKEDLNEATKEIYNDYRLLQYDAVSGSQYAEDLGFYDLKKD